MAKKIFKRKKEEVNKVREVIYNEKNVLDANLPTIIGSGNKAAGSIGEVTSKSLYFKQWVGMKQHTNPLIGKHVSSAPEYSTECVIVDQKISDLSDALKTTINSGAEGYNPSNDTTEVEDLGKSPKVDHNQDKKFIDINIIENATRLLVGKTDDVIENTCKQQMKAYHDDPNYETKMPVKSIIENYRDKLIASKESKPKYLK